MSYCSRCPNQHYRFIGGDTHASCPQCGRSQHRHETPVDLTRYAIDGEVELKGEKWISTKVGMDDYMRGLMHRSMSLHEKYAGRAAIRAFAGDGTISHHMEYRDKPVVSGGTCVMSGPVPLDPPMEVRGYLVNGRKQVLCDGCQAHFQIPQDAITCVPWCDDCIAKDQATIERRKRLDAVMRKSFEATKPGGLKGLIEETGIEEPRRDWPRLHFGPYGDFPEDHRGLPLDGDCVACEWNIANSRDWDGPNSLYFVDGKWVCDDCRNEELRHDA